MLIYQDLCYPVTKEFREKLYGAILDTYKKEKEKKPDGACEPYERLGTGESRKHSGAGDTLSLIDIM